MMALYFLSFYVVVEVGSDHFEHRKHNLITIKCPIIVSTFTTNITKIGKAIQKVKKGLFTIAIVDHNSIMYKD